MRNSLILGSIFALTSCSTAYWKSSADLEVGRIIEELEADHITPRPTTVKLPAPAPEPPDPVEEGGSPEGQEPPEAEEATILNLREALQRATEKNRSYQSQRESLYRSVLSLTLTRHNFGPLFSSTVSYLMSDAEGADKTGSADGSVGITKVLPTGGDLSISGSTSVTGEQGAGLKTGRETDASIRTTLSQPLLQGFGQEVAYESLTQAERDAVYSIRSFELFREDFTIDVFTRYYNLVSQKRVIANERQNYEQFQFLRRRSEALNKVDRAPKLDVLRARQQELSAQDRLTQVEENYQSQLDSFKIFLGFDPEDQIEIADEQPKFQAVRLDEESAIEAALANRLDLKTTKERLEDAERGVRIAEDGLLPELNLDLSSTYASRTRTVYNRISPFQEPSWSAGLTLELPIDKKSERNAYRNSLINRDRARRQFELDRDNTIEEVRRTMRRLRRSENSINIQQMIVESERKRVRIAEIRFEAGEIENRDVVEARQGLLDAENSLIEEIVNHEISRIQLLRDLGILFLDQDGMPVEATPAEDEINE